MKRFRVITYNIHKGIGGVDRRYRLQRVIETIAHCEADIVLLQEVDDGVPRSSRHRQVDLLGDALEMPHRAFQRNVRLTVGHYGNAILSKFPLRDIEDIDLSVRFKKRRRALMAHCHVRHEGHDRTMLLVNFHLGLAGFERRIQLGRVLTHERLHRTHQHTPVIVGGDFNDVWGGLGKRMMQPAGFLPTAGMVRTFPAVVPVRPLDRIYFKGDVELDHSFASHTQVARQASDHLPMVAEFRLRFE